MPMSSAYFACPDAGRVGARRQKTARRTRATGMIWIPEGEQNRQIVARNSGAFGLVMEYAAICFSLCVGPNPASYGVHYVDLPADFLGQCPCSRFRLGSFQ